MSNFRVTLVVAATIVAGRTVYVNPETPAVAGLLDSRRDSAG